MSTGFQNGISQFEKIIRPSLPISFHSFGNLKKVCKKLFFHVDAIALAAYAKQLLPCGKAVVCSILPRGIVWTHLKASPSPKKISLPKHGNTALQTHFLRQRFQSSDKFLMNNTNELPWLQFPITNNKTGTYRGTGPAGGGGAIGGGYLHTIVITSSPSISKPGWNRTTILLVKTRTGSWKSRNRITNVENFRKI